MRDSEAIVMALAADHRVRNNESFLAACREGLVAATGGRIITFGVKPERAATVAGDVCAVAKFVEEPDPATAAEYVRSGCLWNSGNFMFRASVP